MTHVASHFLRNISTVSMAETSSEHSVTPSFVDLNDLASARVGGSIVFATDDWFAVAENLLKAEPPEWQDGVFTSFGKWMDGWETRRKRIPGHDWCVIKLGIPGIIKGLDISTAHFTGNFPPKVSVQAACLERDDNMFPVRESKMGSKASEDQMKMMAKLNTEKWTEILQMTELKPGYLTTCHNYFTVSCTQRWTHLRLNIYPDGGIARLRVYGLAVKDWTCVPRSEMVDLAAMENGGTAVAWSNMHYGHPRNLIAPNRGVNMGDGWETARRMDRPSILQLGEDGCLKVPGCEWSVIQLGHPGFLKKIEIDTNHFKGNFPDSCTVEGCLISKGKQRSLGNSTIDWGSVVWKKVLPSTKMSPHKRHYFSGLEDCGVISHVRLTMAPDGGVSRLRCWGVLSPQNPSRI